MKNVLTLLFVLATGLCFGQNESFKLKVMCYNINFGQVATTEELSALIKSRSVDLAALQEIDNKTYRPTVKHQNGVDILTTMAYQTQMMPLFGKSIDFAGGLYGLGVLSKFPFIKSETITLPHPSGAKEQRIALITQLLLPSKDTLIFVSTHLDHSTSAVRKEQISTINQALSAYMKRYPIVLCGDFNAEPDSPEINGMEPWMKVGDNKNTFSTKEPHTKIDYIFLYPKNSWQVNEYQVDDQVKLSDHLPLISEIEYLKRNN